MMLWLIDRKHLLLYEGKEHHSEKPGVFLIDVSTSA
jgi:hypothetical protein